MRKHIPINSDSFALKQSQNSFSSLVTLEQMNELTNYQYAHNSLLSMTNDWNRFVQFCQLKRVTVLPASITAIRLFLEKESQYKKYASLRRYSLTIGLIHRLHLLADPTNHRQIHFTLAALRNLKKGDATQANPFTSSHLKALHTLLKPNESLKDLRDLIIYHLMFECVLKRGQLRQLQISDIHISQTVETEAYLIHQQQHYPISVIARDLIKRWLFILNEENGYLLRRIDKHENIGQEPLNDSSIYRVFRRASDLLRLPEHLKFSGQSSRVGATQELYRQGYDLRQIQDIGRWMSPVMPAQYLGKHQLSRQQQVVFKRIKNWD